MTEAAVKTATTFVLPVGVVTKADMSRLLREAEQIDNELTTAAVRAKAGAAAQAMPVMSAQFREFLDHNGLTFEGSTQARTDLIKQLRLLKEKAPVIHMTFAVAADSMSLQKLVSWVRTSIHPQALIEVGLQPGLVAGVHLRTPNRVHDFSLRTKLEGQHELLVNALEALRGSR